MYIYRCPNQIIKSDNYKLINNFIRKEEIIGKNIYYKPKNIQKRPVSESRMQIGKHVRNLNKPKSKEVAVDNYIGRFKRRYLGDFMYS